MQEDALLPETANKLTRTERELLLYYRALPIQERVKMMSILHDLAKEAGEKIKNSQPAENQPVFLLHCLYSGQAFQL